MNVKTPVAKGIEALGGATAGHARLSPSGSKRWMSCPGSIVLESFIPNRSTTYSDDGTACHEVAAACLLSAKNAIDFVNEYIPVSQPDASRPGEPERKVHFTDDLAEISQQYIDDIRIKSKGHKLWVETRVEFSDWVGVPDQFGTADAAMLLPIDGSDMLVELNVDDLKGGRTPVSVEKNSQLMVYALGFLSKLGAEYSPPVGDLIPGGSFDLIDGRSIRSIRLSIHQPKLHPGPIEWVCTPKELLDFSFTLRSKAISVENAAQHYKVIPIEQWNETYLNQNPTEEECAFCRAKATCPTTIRKLEATVGAHFEVIAEDDGAIVKPIMMSEDKLSAAMEASGLLEDFIKAVRAEVERRLLVGVPVKGFGLELGRKGNKTFTDEEAATKMLRESFRLRVEDVYSFKLKTPTQLKKLSEPKKVGEGVELPPVIGPRQWPKLAKLITQADPKPSVKRAADIKTPYVAPAISTAAFSVVPEEAEADDEQLY